MEKLEQFKVTKLNRDQLMTVTGGNHETSWSSTSASGTTRSGGDNIATGTTVTKYYEEPNATEVPWMQNNNDNHLL